MAPSKDKESLVVGFTFVAFLVACWVANPVSAEGAVEFDYRADNPKGPQHWGDLNPDWSTCKNGKTQSPIEISEKTSIKIVTGLRDLDVNYQPANATIKNEEHAISVIWEGDAGTITINGTQYFLKKCHWHHPSEHIVNGKRFDLELHMVHKTPDDSKLAVIGFLYRLGQPNSFITKVTSHIRSISDVIKGVPLGVVDPRKVKKAHFEMAAAPKARKASSKFFRYMGSLTTPPCAEGVVWHLNKKVQTVSIEQVNLLKRAVFEFAENNARPIQPLNGRLVKLYGDHHKST